MRILFLAGLLFFASANIAPAQEKTEPSSSSKKAQETRKLIKLTKPIRLLDNGLDAFEVWMGPVHPSVKGMPDGTPTNKNMRKGTPLGLGKDHKNTFSMTQEDKQPTLKITGEVYGGLTTKDDYGNYHLSVEFRWGEQKWEPRLKQKRDSGIVYHCFGDHGQHANSWKPGLEFQVQEQDLGDFIGLAGAKAMVRVSPVKGKEKQKQKMYDPKSETKELTNRYTFASNEPNLPTGQWNKLDLYVMDDRAVHVVNGEIVFALFDAIDKKRKPLKKGQIQIQSEGAECYYREMILAPIANAKVPEKVLKLLKDP